MNKTRLHALSVKYFFTTLYLAMVTTIFLVVVFLVPMHLVHATNTMYIIGQDSTGDDCGLIGTWDVGNEVCTLTAQVSSSSSIQLWGGTLDGGGYVFDGTINAVGTATIKHFQFTGNGISINTRNAVTITDNDFTASSTVSSVSFQTDSIIHNNFYTIPPALIGTNSGSFIISQLLPTGGNYYSFHTCLDTDMNGVCDTPYTSHTSGGTIVDNAAWVHPSGWLHYASVIKQISVRIASNGDVPNITVACAIGHAYTEALYNNTGTLMVGDYDLSGGTSRAYCATGSITFAGWNMNTVLDSINGVDAWGSYFRTPFKYVIKDSTQEGGCNSSASCDQLRLNSAWDGYSNTIYIPSTTCYNDSYNENACTLADGPDWSTVPFTHVWTNPLLDIPIPPPPGDPKNLPAPISPTGDVPSVSIHCTPGHDYMSSLIHEDNGMVQYSLGGIQRVYCLPGVNNNIIAFSGFNLMDKVKWIDPQWWVYVRTPLEYIIKDTTGIGFCDDEACSLISLPSDANNYNYNLYLASSTVYPTVGVGPVYESDDHVTWFNPNAGDSNVLFLPGLEASRLYETTKANPIKLWDPTIGTPISDLYLDNNGKSIKPIYTKDIIDKTPTFSVYQGFISNFNNLVSNRQINQWTPYAYDWRQGVQDIVDNGTPYQGATTSLIDTLQNLVHTSKNGKVTIVAHSNGGLLAKALIAKLQTMKQSGQNDLIDDIDNLVMVAVPQIGTPEGLSALLTGYGEDVRIVWGLIPIISTSQVRDLAVNMSSAYSLLPSAAYFGQTGIKSPISFSSSAASIFTTRYTSSIYSYNQERDFVLGKEGRTAPSDGDTSSPLIGNAALLAQGESLHSIIDNVNLIPSSIKVYTIAGTGKETVNGMTYGNDSIDPIFTSLGDGIVVEQSALYGTSTPYWLDLSKSKLDHAQIMQDPQVLSFLDSVVDHTSVSTLSSTRPIRVGNRLHLSVHSPVSIGVYDSAGDFTGKTCDDNGNCTVSEDIPGSTYLEFGEGKYVNLGESDMQSAVLQGTDAGTFTFDYDIVSPTGATSSAVFQNIPVTTQTQATITVNATTSQPQLALDVTGDGVTDFMLTPNSVFDPISFLNIMKATIDSLDLTQAKKDNLDRRILNTITLIQKGKIDKVKLKVSNFVGVLQNVLAKPDPKHPKPKKLSKADAQVLLDMLNTLLDNLN
jgi:hypothetical protein